MQIHADAVTTVDAAMRATVKPGAFASMSATATIPIASSAMQRFVLWNMARLGIVLSVRPSTTMSMSNGTSEMNDAPSV